MEKVNKILVPIDFTPCSEGAVRYATFLAGQLDATLLLAHIIRPLGYPIDFALVQPAAYRELKKEVGRAMEEVADRWRRTGIPVETHLFKGDPAAGIVQAAADLACDLIVMGTHGRKGVAHFLMGSVAEQVVRGASVPVVTLRPEIPVAADRPAAARPEVAADRSEAASSCC